MIRYLDSSVVVALLVNEAHSSRVEAWLAQHSEDVALSRWVETEVAAALSAKIRSARLDDRLAEEARTTFSRVVPSSRRLPIAARHFEQAMRFAAVVDAKLRSGDALHLAIASEAGAVMCTLDRRQAEAARILDVESELI